MQMAYPIERICPTIAFRPIAPTARSSLWSLRLMQALGVMFIRDYQPSDQKAIDAIQVESQVDLDAATPPGYFDDLSDIRSAFCKGKFIIVEIDNEVAGFGGLLPSGEIVRMRVAIRHRRKGLARAILSQLLCSACDLGMKSVHLHTLQEQVSAQVLYTNFGFIETSRGELHGNKVVSYELTL